MVPIQQAASECELLKIVLILIADTCHREFALLAFHEAEECVCDDQVDADEWLSSIRAP